MRYRISRQTVTRMLEAAGFRELSNESDERTAFQAMRELSAVASGLPVWDRARVYVAAIEHFEALGMRAPDLTEDLFFDPFVSDIAQFAPERVRNTPGEKREDEVVDALGATVEEKKPSRPELCRTERARITIKTRRARK